MPNLNKLSELKKLCDKNNALLVAVSKTKSVEEILSVYNAGQKVFGENKVQEITDKYEQLPKDIEWHFIGHLQRNKVKYIAPFVDLIHGVDSLRLAKEINKQANNNQRKIRVLLQMHIAQESTKFGFDMDELTEILSAGELLTLENLEICGLMGMATFTDDAEQVDQEFSYLYNCFQKIQSRFFSNKENFKEISMGMSGDYELALKNGSTMVRVGSAIFGER
ncbi:MAG: YggS family pyridoxal phosphate-dependent enzyme [Bacteroidetes bacterium]|nr:YggS family pyridoxal phosphate-dependent enzyme [Bacteroidota bacterium]